MLTIAVVAIGIGLFLAWINPVLLGMFELCALILILALLAYTS